MHKLEYLIDDYLKYCECQKKLSSHTLKAYKIDTQQFINFIKIKDEMISKNDLSGYITYLYEQYKPKTIKRKIATIKAFFNYLEYEEISNDNPFSKMNIRIKETFQLPRIISFNHIQSILSAAHQEIEKHKTMYQHKVTLRDIAALELLFATGVRVSELCSLTISDVNLLEGFIRVNGKGGKERVIQITNNEVLLSLKQYRNASYPRSQENRFFFLNRLGSRLSEQSVRYIIKKYVDKAQLPDHITPHMFRHTFATLLLEEEVDIRYIQELLGHSSIVTTQIYTHVSLNKQKTILANKHPRNKMIINKG